MTNFVSTESVRAKAEPEDNARLRSVRAEAQCELLRVGIDVREIEGDKLSPVDLDAALVGRKPAERIRLKSLCAAAGWL